MTLWLLAYAGGVLTILSPCILPVLPFVFARADRPFVRSGLPMLIGMAVTFALIATLAAVAGGWAVEANRYGRMAALVLLALFGLALLFPIIADRATRPLVALGSRLSQSTERDGAPGMVSSLLLGVATGLLWAPCAGPVLGLILTGAALQGANVQTSLLLLAFAAGAATLLALAVLAGGRVFAAMKRSLGASEWIRRGFGAAVLVAVAAIALGADTGFLTRISFARTAALEQRLLDLFQTGSGAQSMSGSPSMTMSGTPAPAGPSMGGPPMTMAATPQTEAGVLPAEGMLPALTGAVAWLNSPPLTREELKGKVVVIDFWTYSCINCLRSLPYVRAWAEKYKDQGLVVIGVHAPEFAFEKDIDNVKKAVADLHVTYPVAIDNDYAIWRALDNHYWPAHYFIDAQGRIRHHHFGEGEYDQSERIIQQLLAEAGRTNVATEIVSVSDSSGGAQSPSNPDQVRSPETYIGYERAEHFISPGGAVENAPHVYSPGKPGLNEWGLSGDWSIAAEQATLNTGAGSIVYRFHARDLHLVLGPAPGKSAIRFRITIDGAPPGANRGSDVDAAGNGVVSGQRLYQLVRQSGALDDRTFEIRFLDPGVQAYAFTFG